MKRIEIKRDVAERAMSKAANMMNEISKIIINGGGHESDWLYVSVVSDDESNRSSMSLITFAAQVKERAQCFRILSEDLFSQSSWNHLESGNKKNWTYDFQAATRDLVKLIGPSVNPQDVSYRHHLICGIAAFLKRGSDPSLESINSEAKSMEAFMPEEAWGDILREAKAFAFSSWETDELSRGS